VPGERHLAIGRGIAADGSGAVCAVSGNGKFDAASGGCDYGNSVIKLGFQNGAFGVRDYFTPFDQERLNPGDVELGSSGPVLLPRSARAASARTGYGGESRPGLRDRSRRMRSFHAGSDSHAGQTLQAGTGAFGAPLIGTAICSTPTVARR